MIENKGINHIGIAVRTLEGKRELYEGILGGVYQGEEVVDDQQVRVAFFLFGAAGHEVRIELLEPTNPTSPVAKFIEKRGEGIHHVAFTVSNIEERIAQVQAAGLKVIDQTPRSGAHHNRIAFIHPKDTFGVLTEMCEPELPTPAPVTPP
jgi:methylmalonyl-CoA/ethylmalonyl-CoA epimerase